MDWLIGLAVLWLLFTEDKPGESGMVRSLRRIVHGAAGALAVLILLVVGWLQ